jgi:hypothetical protein
MRSRKPPGLQGILPLALERLWHQPPHDLRRRWSRLIDRDALRGDLLALLRIDGQPIAYEVFSEKLALGDEDIAIVIGDAEWDTIYVAQRERGALSAISVHSSGERAVSDFLGRALTMPGETEALAARLIRRLPANGPTH